jgi:hypothetical protein
MNKQEDFEKLYRLYYEYIYKYELHLPEYYNPDIPKTIMPSI